MNWKHSHILNGPQKKKKKEKRESNTSTLFASSVRVTSEPNAAAVNPGKEVPAPSCKLIIT